MRVGVTRGPFAEVEPLRALYLRELNAQMRYDAVHSRGRSDVYVLRADDEVVGYGAVMGERQGERDTVFEWYVLPPWRASWSALFDAFVEASGAKLVESQTNDPCLYPIVRGRCSDLTATAFLFEAGEHRAPSGPGVVRLRGADDEPFAHTAEPVGSHVLDVEGEIVATGGFLTHYNRPFADLYMEVAPESRRRGYGTRIVVCLMRECWLAGHVPAARCGVDNHASRRTLSKAGMSEVGQLLRGRLGEPAELVPRREAR